MKPLSEIVQARRMRLAGDVLREMEDRSANIAMNWTQKTWRRPTTFTEDLQGFAVTWRNAKKVANDRRT